MWVNAMDPMIVGKGVNSNFRGAFFQEVQAVQTLPIGR